MHVKNGAVPKYNGKMQVKNGAVPECNAYFRVDKCLFCSDLSDFVGLAVIYMFIGYTRTILGRDH